MSDTTGPRPTDEERETWRRDAQASLAEVGYMRTQADRILRLNDALTASDADLATLRAERDEADAVLRHALGPRPVIGSTAVLARALEQDLNSEHERAEAAEASRDALQVEVEQARRTSQFHKDNHLAAEARIDALTAQVKDGTLSDGYHSFNELYVYRKVYNALLFNEWAALGVFDVHKSRQHSDGEPCFGGGWFIVVAQLPSGQVSNHYKDADWDLFRVPIRDRGSEYDGHTPAQALERLQATLSAGAESTRLTAQVAALTAALRKAEWNGRDPELYAICPTCLALSATSVATDYTATPVTTSCTRCIWRLARAHLQPTGQSSAPNPRRRRHERE